MAPKPDQLVRVPKVRSRNRLDALDDLGEVAEVEDVVTLGRSRQEISLKFGLLSLLSGRQIYF